MMSDEIITPLHLQTIEKYMSSTSESVQKLAESVNELVIAERERTVRDERVQEQIETIKAKLEKHEDGIKWATKMSKLIDNYIMRVAFPIIVTSLTFAVIASTVDLSKFTGG